MEPTIEVTGHISKNLVNSPELLQQMKDSFLDEVRRHGHTPVTDVEVRRLKMFPHVIDLSADADGYRYYLSVMVKA